ncbi:MAG: peptidase M15 [Chloroflexi bacterium]|nr:peptidase M15 [Chloroflexota bacterium]PWB43403.1 MAG: peptidase M15 [Dehalococcoidia bacterium]
MTYREPARQTTRGTLRPIAIFLVVLTVAITGLVVYQLAPSFSEAHLPDIHRAASQFASQSAPSLSEAHSPDTHHAAPLSSAPSFSEAPRRNHGRGTTGDDGVLPDGVTAFDGGYPGVANLDPDLLQALREAATDAADNGIEFYVNSGWRSAEYQDQLLREAISEYGSKEEAARWVSTADTSAHVSGDAVDIGHSDALAWLSEHGAKYGLCQIYRNEPWHYELRPEAVDDDCPPMYADPTHDPRMQR